MLRLLMVVTTLAISLAACSRSDAGTKPTPNPRESFLSVVRQQAPPTSGIVATSDQRIWDAGDGSCNTLRENSKRTPAQVSTEYDRMWPGAGSTIVGAALTFLCPDLNGRAGD